MICSVIQTNILFTKTPTYRLSQVSLRSFLHLSKHHGGDLLRGEGLQLTSSNLHLNMGLGLLLKNLEKELFK